MNWVKQEINLGVLKENKTYTFDFVSTKELNIVNIKISCTKCTKVKPYANNRIRVVYTTSMIPVHLNSRKQSVNKHIVVTYADGTEEILKYTGTVRK